MSNPSLKYCGVGASILIGLLAFLPTASAFDVDGFHSGMTREQLSVSAKELGLEVKEVSPVSWVIGKFAENRIDGSFSFCDKSLVSYSRDLDFDIDYVPTLRSLIQKYGQPKRILSEQMPWSGPGGGSFNNVEILWYKDDDRFTLSFSPEERDGEGKLRHLRGAWVAYATKNSCWTVPW